jgi:predicted protein tyrosine phosphatase
MKIPDFVVCPLSEARGRILSGWATHVVSLVDPDTPIPDRAHTHLVMELDDTSSHMGPAVPQLRHAQAMIAFVRALPEDARLVVHCHAGISRSPAAAIGMMAALGNSPEESVRAVALVRPVMLPNNLLVSHFDHALGLGGSLVSAVIEWKRGNLSQGLVVTG